MLSKPNTATDKALAQALDDANQRAARLAQHQNAKLGKIYSISEFNTRQQESYQLRVSRTITGSSFGDIPTLQIGEAREVFNFSNGAEPFEPGVIKASAQVFVVYLLK